MTSSDKEIQIHFSLFQKVQKERKTNLQRSLEFSFFFL